MDVPDQNLPQGARKLAVDVLLCVAELDVHVAVDALLFTCTRISSASLS